MCGNMWSDNRGEKKKGTRFANLHPAVLFAYLAAVLAATMFVTHPLLLLADFLAAWGYTTFFCKRSMRRRLLAMAAIILTVTTVGNGLFSHNGEIVLFFFGDTRYTMEAFCYGAVIGCVLVTVLLWFICMGEILTSEKILFLFGSMFPSLTLTICMMLRYLPMLRRRYEIIQRAQRAMGRVGGVRQRAKEFSILISWSLENAIDTSDVMESRGYGLGKRSHYSVFVFTFRDGCHLALIVVLGILSVLAVLLPEARSYYFPTIVLPKMSVENLLLYAGYLLLLFYPAAVAYGGCVWRENGGKMQWN